MSEDNYVFCEKSNIMFNVYRFNKESFAVKYLLYKFKTEFPKFLNGWSDNEVIEEFNMKCQIKENQKNVELWNSFKQEDKDEALNMLGDFDGRVIQLEYDEDFVSGYGSHELDGSELLKEINEKEREYAFLWLDHLDKHASK